MQPGPGERDVANWISPHSWRAAWGARGALRRVAVGRSIYLMPTTRVVLQIVASSDARGRILVGCERLLGGAITGWPIMGPADALRHANSLAAGEPACFISFPDQCVEPHLAPIRASTKQGERFFPIAEILLAGRYGFRILGQRADACEDLDAGDDVATQTCRQLERYFEACDRLGPEWLAAWGQHWRSPEGRARMSMSCLRTLQASVLHFVAGPEAEALSEARRNRLLQRVMGLRPGAGSESNDATR
jgi:hypothetical protein